MADMHLQTTLLVASMRRAGVRLLVLDFDQTLVSVHTHGKWPGPGSELGRYVRPFFLELVPVALRKGLAVSVATLSPQRRVVQHALADAFGPTVARQILVRCLDGTWTPALECEIPEAWRLCSRRGKAEHVLSVVSKIYAARYGSGEEGLIEPGNVCIIDDDVTTVKQARLDGMAAFVIAAHEVPERSLDLSSQLGRDMLAHYRCKALAAASSALPLESGSSSFNNKRARGSNPQSDDFGAADLVICDVEAEAQAQSAAQAAPRQRTRTSPGSSSLDGAEPSAGSTAAAAGSAIAAECHSAAETPSTSKLAAEYELERAPPMTHVFKVARGSTGSRRSTLRRLPVVDGCCTM
jgi:hypothetical protein